MDASLAPLYGQLSGAISELADLIDSRDWCAQPTSEAVSLVALKCRALELYNANLLRLTADRLAGLPPPGRTVERLCELRCLLECARPVETRVRHQIDRLVQLAGDASDAAGGPTAARLEDFQLSDEEGDGDESSVEDARTKKPAKSAASARAGKYVPPKVTPMFYEEQPAAAAAGKRGGAVETEADRRAKRRAIQLDVLEELRQQMDDAPLEVSERRGAGASGRLRVAEERRRYEEANMTRLSVSRRQRQLEMRARRLGGDFETLSGLLPAGLEAGGARGGKRAKGPRGKLARKLGKRSQKSKKKRK